MKPRHKDRSHRLNGTEETELTVFFHFSSVEFNSVAAIDVNGPLLRSIASIIDRLANSRGRQAGSQAEACMFQCTI